MALPIKGRNNKNKPEGQRKKKGTLGDHKGNHKEMRMTKGKENRSEIINKGEKRDGGECFGSHPSQCPTYVRENQHAFDPTWARPHGWCDGHWPRRAHRNGRLGMPRTKLDGSLAHGDMETQPVNHRRGGCRPRNDKCRGSIKVLGPDPDCRTCVTDGSLPPPARSCPDNGPGASVQDGSRAQRLRDPIASSDDVSSAEPRKRPLQPV